MAHARHNRVHLKWCPYSVNLWKETLTMISEIGTRCMFPWAWLAACRRDGFLVQRSDPEAREALGLGGPDVITDAELNIEDIIGAPRLSDSLIMPSSAKAAASGAAGPQPTIPNFAWGYTDGVYPRIGRASDASTTEDQR